MAQVIQPAEVRSRLREALELDLIGPGAGHPLVDERLPGWVRPSNWYLTGFLVPRGASAEQRADADADDDFEPEVADEGGLGDDSTEDRRAAKKGFFPSSMGLSFLAAEGRRQVGRDRPVGRLPLRRGRNPGRRKNRRCVRWRRVIRQHGWPGRRGRCQERGKGVDAVATYGP